MLSKIGSAVISSEKKFGDTLGQAAASMDKGIQSDIEKANKTYMETGQRLAKLARESTDQAQRDKYLKMANENFEKAGSTYKEVLPAIEKTNKQIAGEAAGVALDVVTAGAAGKVATNAAKTAKVVKPIEAVAKVEKASKASALAGSVAKNAKNLAPLGAAYGTTEAMQEGAENKDIAKSAVAGAAITTAGGVVLSGVAKKIGKLTKTGKAQTAANKALDNILAKPQELTPTEYEEMLKAGRVTAKSKTGAAKIIPTKQEREYAVKYSKLLKNSDPVKNANSVINEISNRDKEVGEFLKENNAIFNKAQLKAYLSQNMKDVSDISIPQSRIEKVKETLIDNFVNNNPNLAKNNVENLWIARKKFDKEIEKAFSGSPTLQKEIKKSLRNGVQNFIAKKTPDGVYKQQMKDMSEMFDILDMVDNKAVREKGQSAMDLWKKNNKGKVNALKWALIGIGAERTVNILGG
ncbi:MAG: hypothetical protein WCQ96_03120 [Patescibacteria group bacterium]